MFVKLMHVWWLQRPEKGVRSPEIAGTDGYWSLSTNLKKNTCFLIFSVWIMYVDICM